MKIEFFENLLEQQLLCLHTCYLAKVLSVNNGIATIQPLNLVKAYGNSAKRQAVMNAPINKAIGNVSLTGKTAIVMCAERDISQTRKGIFALPVKRRHSLSDSIVIGYL